jgi:hypothetical protein
MTALLGSSSGSQYTKNSFSKSPQTRTMQCQHRRVHPSCFLTITMDYETVPSLEERLTEIRSYSLEDVVGLISNLDLLSVTAQEYENDVEAEWDKDSEGNFLDNTVRAVIPQEYEAEYHGQRVVGQVFWDFNTAEEVIY